VVVVKCGDKTLTKVSTYWFMEVTKTHVRRGAQP